MELKPTAELIPPQVSEIIGLLKAHTYTAYLAGECVTQLLRGEKSLDIDLITAKRSRKRLKSIELTECSEGGKAEPGMAGEYLCPAKKSDNLYYLVRTHNGAKETVIIDPNQMMKDAFGCYMGKSFKK